MNGNGQGFSIDHGPLRVCILEEETSAMDVAKATGIPLPKILRLLNLAGGRVRNDEISGFELVRLCAYVGLPISAVVRMEDSE